MAPRMFATLVSSSETRVGPIQAGDLVCVEVPPNCTIHSIDAARLAKLRLLAVELRGARAAGISAANLGQLVDAICEVADTVGGSGGGITR